MNIHFADAAIAGHDNVGALAAFNDGEVSRCFVWSGAVKGNSFTGGLVGVNEANGRIRECACEIEVAANWVGYNVGGLVGCNKGRITDCYATGHVRGLENPGGLVGLNSGRIWRCYASGKVEDSSDFWSEDNPRGCGGLVALNHSGGTIEDCFASGEIAPRRSYPVVGWLVGLNESKASVLGSFCVAGTSGAIEAVGRRGGESGSIEVQAIARASMGARKTPGPVFQMWDFEKTWLLDRLENMPSPRLRAGNESGRKGSAPGVLSKK